MATPVKFIETLSGIPTTNTVPTSAGLASIPVLADNAIIRVEGATCRWSETTGSMLSASTGLLVSPADAPFRISNLAAFRITALGNGGVLQAAYYQGFFVL